MRVRRAVKEKDVIKIWVFGYDRKLIKSANDLTRESDRVHKMDNKIKSWKE